MEKTIRTFIASALPVEIIDFASGLQNRLKRDGLSLKWVKPGNMHLTLKFLGDITPGQSRTVLDAIQIIGERHAPLALTVQGMGFFPGIRKPRVLWIGLGGETDQLGRLHAQLEDALAESGFKKENRRFSAHLTIARIGKPLNSGHLLDILQAEGRYYPIPFAVRELVLFKSDLRPRGAVYTPLGTVMLKGVKKDNQV